MTGRFRRASITTLSNGALSGVRAVVSFVTVSMLVQYLGRESYGLCATITGMASWLSITQGGIGQSLRNDIIREPGSASAAFSGAFAFATIVVLTVGGVLTAIVRLLPWKTILNDPEFHQLPLIVMSIWIVLFTALLSLVRAAYAAFQMEFKLAPALLAGLLISFSLVVVGMYRGWSTPVVISSSLLANLIGLTLGFIGMPVHFLWPARLHRAGLWFFVIEACTVAIFEADIFLVNFLLGASQAAVFALHAQLFVYVQAGIVLLVSPYWAALGDAWNAGEKAWFAKAVRRLAGATGILSCLGVITLIAIGRPLMNRWSHGQIGWNPALAVLIAMNVVIQGVTGVYATALGALGIAREPARIIVVQAILNVGVCVWSIRRFGVMGAALGSLVTYALTSGLYLPFKVRGFMSVTA